MATYYFNSPLTWREFLQVDSFVQDITGTVRRGDSRLATSISDQTRAIVASTEALSRVFGADFDALHGAIEIGFGTLATELNALGEGIDRLGASFSYGMTLLAEQMDAQTIVLRGIHSRLVAIHRTLQTPNRTQAREFFEMGRERLSKGLLDKALDAFLKAEQRDDVDFLTQQHLGLLYMYGRDVESDLIDLPKAETHFRNAARYAKAEIAALPEAARFCGEANFHASIALYAMAAEKRQAGDSDEARRLLAESAMLSYQAATVYPALAESLFHHAKVTALLGQVESSLQSLKSATKADPLYCLKADADHDFDSLREDVFELFEGLRDAARDEARTALDNIRCLLDSTVFATPEAMRAHGKIEELVKNAERVFLVGSFLDYVQARSLCKQASSQLERIPVFEARKRVKCFNIPISRVQFSTDGDRLGAVSSKHDATKVSVVEVSTGSIISAFAACVDGVSFTHDARFFLLARDRTIHIVDVASKCIIATAVSQAGEFLRFSKLSPDGEHFAAIACLEGTKSYSPTAVEIWRIPNLKRLARIPGAACAFNRDGSMVACYDHLRGIVSLYSIPECKELARFTNDDPSHCAYGDKVIWFSGNDRYLAVQDKRCVLWEIPSRRKLMALQNQGGFLTFSPDAAYVLTHSYERVRLFELPSGQEITKLDCYATAKFGPNPCRLLVSRHHSWEGVSYNHDTNLLEFPSCKKLAQVKLEWKDAKFTVDGRFLVFLARDGGVAVWDCDSGGDPVPLPGWVDSEGCFDVSPDGLRIAAGERAGHVQIWERSIFSQAEFESVRKERDRIADEQRRRNQMQEPEEIAHSTAASRPVRGLRAKIEFLGSTSG